MKKLVAVILSFALILGISACGDSAEETTTASTTVEETTEDEGAPEETTAEEPEETTAEETPAEETEEPAGEGVQLTLWDFHTDAEGAFFENLVADYNAANPGVTFTYELVSQDDYRGTKMATAFASGTGPDVLQLFPGSLLKYANTGVLAALDDYIEPAVLDDFYESSIDGVTVAGEIVAIPFEIELLGLGYNKSVLAEAGVEPPTTWDELRETANTLTTADMYGYNFTTNRGEHQLFEWYPFLWQEGASVFNEDGTAAAFNTPGVIAYLQHMRDMLEEGSANIKPTRDNGDAAAIGDGEAAMMIMGSWADVQLANAFPEGEFGVVPLPTSDTGSPASVAGGWKLAANADSPHLDEAIDFVISAFASEDISYMVEWCTEAKFAFPTRASAFDEALPAYEDGGMREIFANEILGTEQVEMRLPPEVSAILQDMLQTAYLDTSVSVEDAVAQGEAEVNEFLASYDGEL